MKKIKKIFAIVGGLVLIGATLTGCVSKGTFTELQTADLAKAQEIEALNAGLVAAKQESLDYADQNNALNEVLAENQLVIDEKDAEILAQAEEIAAQLEAEEAKLAEQTTEAALESEEYDGLVLGEDVPAKAFDTYDLSFLNKDEIEFNDNDYDFKEYIKLDGLKVGIAFTDDVDFEDSPYLLFNEKGAVSYTFKFDDTVDFTKITEDETLEINFLGNDIEIVKLDADEFTYKIAESHKMLKGEVVEYDGHNITLVSVSENGDDVVVEVDGVMQVIDEGESEEFDGLEVFNKKAFVSHDVTNPIEFAELEFGADVLQTIEDGDEYNKDNEDFVWEFETDGDELVSLSLMYDVKANDLDEEILGVDEALNFLDYFDVKFGLEDEYDYVSYSISFDEVTDDDVPVMAFETDNEDIRVGDEKVKVAYFDGTNSYYKDSDNDWVVSEDVIELENDDLKVGVGYNGDSVTIGDLKLKTADFVSFGTEEEAEVDDVIFDGKDLGKVDETIMLPMGVIIESVEDNAEEDEVVIQVPNEEVLGVIRVIQK